MTDHSQSPELFPEIQLSPQAAKPRAARKVKSVAAVAPVAPPLDADAMARALEAHPDYRVQRRLKPVVQWGPPVGNDLLRVVVLDTETTGLDHAKDKIIELALLRFDVDTVTGLPVGEVRVYDGLEDPGMPIPKEVVAITGITDADVKGQLLDEGRIAELLEGVDLVIAHNAGFDRPFAEDRIGAFRQLPWACSFADIDWKAQGRGSAKLESLAHAMGWFYDAHRAEMDCHALLAVLVNPLPTEKHNGLLHLMRASKAPSFRLYATNAPFDAKDLLKARGYRWNADQKVWFTRLGDEVALYQEFDWLKSTVFHQRSAVVQVEKLTALGKYSARPGEVAYRQL